MKAQPVNAYFKALPPTKPTRGITIAEMCGHLESRYGSLMEMRTDHAFNEHGDRIHFLVRSGDGTLEGYIFPNILLAEFEGSKYGLAFRFARWLQKLYPQGEPMYLYNDYALDEFVEITDRTTMAALEQVFGEGKM